MNYKLLTVSEVHICCFILGFGLEISNKGIHTLRRNLREVGNENINHKCNKWAVLNCNNKPLQLGTWNRWPSFREQALCFCTGPPQLKEKMTISTEYQQIYAYWLYKLSLFPVLLSTEIFAQCFAIFNRIINKIRFSLKLKIQYHFLILIVNTNQFPQN